MSSILLPKSLVLQFGLAASLTGLVLGCGRPATEKECRDILRTAALLELKERLGNEQLIEEELKGIESSMEGAMMEKCVGKRITEDKLTCIRGAKTSDQLFGECF
jgi:hypothetical protein